MADEMTNAVMDRLESLAYHIVGEDSLLIKILIDGVTKEILIECNITELPDELKPMAVDAVCGRFLDQKHSSKQLEDYDFTTAVSSITEGDISISYSSGETSNPEETFKACIQEMAKLNPYKLHAFRRLRW